MSAVCLLMILIKSATYFRDADMREVEEQMIANVINRPVPVETVTTHPAFMDKIMPDSNSLSMALVYYNVQFPEVVYAQAILETGNFTSNVCRYYHNLFGLWNSSTKDYYKFEHWSESILAYKMFIQNKYKPPENYFLFLQRIGYAEDSMYIDKLQIIMKQVRFE